MDHRIRGHWSRNHRAVDSVDGHEIVETAKRFGRGAAHGARYSRVIMETAKVHDRRACAHGTCDTGVRSERAKVRIIGAIHGTRYSMRVGGRCSIKAPELRRRRRTGAHMGLARCVLDGPRWERRHIGLLLEARDQTVDPTADSFAAHVVDFHALPHANIHTAAHINAMMKVSMLAHVRRSGRPVHGRGRAKRLPRGMAVDGLRL